MKKLKEKPLSIRESVSVKAVRWVEWGLWLLSPSQPCRPIRNMTPFHSVHLDNYQLQTRAQCVQVLTVTKQWSQPANTTKI